MEEISKKHKEDVTNLYSQNKTLNTELDRLKDENNELKSVVYRSNNELDEK